MSQWLVMAGALYLILGGLTGVFLLSWRTHVRPSSPGEEGADGGVGQLLLLALLWPLTLVALLRRR